MNRIEGLLYKSKREVLVKRKDYQYDAESVFGRFFLVSSFQATPSSNINGSVKMRDRVRVHSFIRGGPPSYCQHPSKQVAFTFSLLSHSAR